MGGGGEVEAVRRRLPRNEGLGSASLVTLPGSLHGQRAEHGRTKDGQMDGREDGRKGGRTDERKEIKKEINRWVAGWVDG